jgi:hypothetical protein
MSHLRGALAVDVGAQLLAKGCRQGSLITHASARMVWLTHSGQAWTVEQDEKVASDASLVVVSQDCDIFASPKNEPWVEAMTAHWTADPNDIHAARKGNSARRFLLTEADGKALVADARRRVHLDKHALLNLAFRPAFDDALAARRFSNWVAGRYNRPAIPNDQVEAIQKPIVSAVALVAKKADPLVGVLKRIDELRFAVIEERPPWTVHLIAMVEPDARIEAEEEAEFAGWLEEVLVVDKGPIKVIALAFRNENTITLGDYRRTTHLQLDQFSAENDVTLTAS